MRGPITLLAAAATAALGVVASPAAAPLVKRADGFGVLVRPKLDDGSMCTTNQLTLLNQIFDDTGKIVAKGLTITTKTAEFGNYFGTWTKKPAGTGHVPRDSATAVKDILKPTYTRLSKFLEKGGKGYPGYADIFVKCLDARHVACKGTNSQMAWGTHRDAHGTTLNVLSFCPSFFTRFDRTKGLDFVTFEKGKGPLYYTDKGKRTDLCSYSKALINGFSEVYDRMPHGKIITALTQIPNALTQDTSFCVVCTLGARYTHLIAGGYNSLAPFYNGETYGAAATALYLRKTLCGSQPALKKVDVLVPENAVTAEARKASPGERKYYLQPVSKKSPVPAICHMNTLWETDMKPDLKGTTAKGTLPVKKTSTTDGLTLYMYPTLWVAPGTALQKIITAAKAH